MQDIMSREYEVILRPEPEGGYSVVCPAVPGAISQGETRQEALENIADAIRLLLEVQDEDARSARKKGERAVVRV